MTFVRVHPDAAADLEAAYGSTKVFLAERIAGLSPLITEAAAILGHSGQNPVTGPIPTLQATANGLGEDKLDLAWRLDWILNTDQTTIRLSEDLAGFAPSNIDFAFSQSGLDDDQVGRVKRAVANGADMAEAKAVERSAAITNGWNAFRRSEAAAWSDGPVAGSGSLAARVLGELSDAWQAVPAKDVTIPIASLLLFTAWKDGGVDDDHGFLDDVRHNILEPNTVVGALVTGRVSPEVALDVFDHAPDVGRTVFNAANEIVSLNPMSIQRAHLLATDPRQFFENHQTFLGGVGDWAIDTGKLVGALGIANNPVFNQLYEQHTGTNVRDEIVTALQSAALLAAEDPDAFAAAAIDWEGLEEDPILWAGNQAPEVVIEVLTGGSATGIVASRRAANLVGDAVDIVDDLPITPSSKVDQVAGSEISDDLRMVDQELLDEVDEVPIRQPGNHDEARAIAQAQGVSEDSVVHLVDGEINKSGRAVGGHDRSSANIRILEQWVDPDTGFDVARIEVFDPSNGQWVTKAADTTLFPDGWSSSRIVEEVQSAFSNSSTLEGRQWIGRSDSGLEITGYYRNPGSPGPGWSTAYPTGGLQS